jgi:hypothetical protein
MKKSLIFVSFFSAILLGVNAEEQKANVSESDKWVEHADEDISRIRKIADYFEKNAKEKIGEERDISNDLADVLRDSAEQKEQLILAIQRKDEKRIKRVLKEIQELEDRKVELYEKLKNVRNTPQDATALRGEIFAEEKKQE